MPQMIIANRLRDGVVVFFDAHGGWDPAIAAGVLTDSDAEAKRLFELAKRDEAQCVVIDPQLIEVIVEHGGRRPKEIREAIRAFGPTVRTDVTEA
jgi:sulfite reductase (NADPH) hemoprotein beta-component